MILETALGPVSAQRTGSPGAPVLQILGIPYAQARRFHAPGPAPRPAPGSPINTGRGHCCPQRLMPRALNLALRHFQLRPEWQPRHDTMDEDCLRLNVWTSGIRTPKPVLVFIHGGDCGSGTLPVYNGARLAELGVVVVTITYRIGVLGHLHVVDGERISCDRALEDQRAALRWVRANIAHLGGDPGAITLMGHCGGAQYALYQALNPGNAGLFHRLILCSGQRATPVPLDRGTEERAFADLLADNGLSGYGELEAMPLRRLLRLRVPRAGLATVMEGGFFSRDPRDALRDGAFPRVPVLIGTTADEFSMIEMPLWYKRMGIATRARDLGARVNAVYGPHGRRIAVELSDDEAGADIVGLQIAMMELVVFHGAALSLMDAFSRHTRVHGYRFAGVPKVYGGRPGSYHGAEVAFFFNTLDRMRIRVPDQDRALVRALQRDWLAFVREGAIPGAPAFDPADPRITAYHQDGTVATAPFPHAGLLRDLEGTDLSDRVIGAYLRRR